jgi:ParB/RepB/Spo0J family partition protein
MKNITKEKYNQMPAKKQKPQITAADDVLHNIDVSQIIQSPFEAQAHRREKFLPEELDELGESILRHGLQQPISVRPVKTESGGTIYELIFGERRWLASKRMNLKTIQGFIRDKSNAEVVELQYEENHKRVKPDPLDDALSFKYLHEQENYSIQKLADTFGVSKTTVRYKLILNDLIPEAELELSAGRLPLKHAYYIATFPETAQREIVENAYAYKYGDIDDGAVSYEHFVSEVEQNIVRNLSSAPFDTEDRQLHMTGLPCSACTERSDNEPRLFAEISKEASCLNKSCFDFKTSVHIRIQRERIAEKMARAGGEKVEDVIEKVPLVTERKFVDNTPFTQKTQTSQELFDEPECEHSVLSLAVEGAKKGRQVYVCEKKRLGEHCDVHNVKPEIVLDDAELQQKEYQFEKLVRERTREKVFAEAINFFDDYKPFWMFDDLVRKLIYELWTNTSADIRKLVRSTLKSWKGFPIDSCTGEELEYYISTLDKRKQSQILFLLIYKTEGYYTGSSFEGVKKIAADYTSFDWQILDAKVRLELAPAEFRQAALDYIAALENGTDCEPPRFWYIEPDDEDFSNVELIIDD